MKSIAKLTLLTTLSTILIFLGCKEDALDLNSRFTDATSQLIPEFLEDEHNNLQKMSWLLQKGGMDKLLNTYGTYTVFAPTDSAFSNYLSSIGKNSIDELDSNQVNELLDFHVILSNVDLKTKNSGLLDWKDTTVSGIRHFVDLSLGLDYIVLNKTSLVQSTDEVANGVVYTIDNVLKPHPNNIYDYLSSTGEYTIITEALKEVGLKDTVQNLDQVDTLYGVIYKYTPVLTLFAESDEVLKNSGINSFQELKAAVWNKSKDIAGNEDEAMEYFVKYHILKGRKTTFDMDEKENLATLGMNESAIIYIDEPIDPRRPEPVLNAIPGASEGITLDDLKSDISCMNGLVHHLNGVLYINTNYVQAEIKRECEDGIRTFISDDGFIEYEFEDTKIGGRGEFSFQNNFQYTSSSKDLDGRAIIFTPVEEGDWIEFILRNVVPGNYNIYLNYKREINNSSQNINMYFRNVKDDFDWETQLFLAGLDLAQKDLSNGGYKNFQQNRELGAVEISEYGDYVFRFAHIDTYRGIYDNIKLVPFK